MTPPPAPPRLWLLVGGVPEGPFDPTAVHRRLMAGEVSWDTLTCPVGGAEWRPLRDQPARAGRAATPPPGLPPANARPGDSSMRPWNPTALAWLTLAFTPLWGGVMAAMNARRVGAGGASVGLAIGLGSTAANFVADSVWNLPYWLDLTWYLCTVAALWACCFRQQSLAYDRVALPDPFSRERSRWVVPALAGSPLALVAFLGFVVWPLVPPNPREVCQAFAEARTAAEAAAFATPHFKPVVTDVIGRAGSEDSDDSVRLTDEFAPPGDPGLYFVGFELRSRTGPGHAAVGGGGAFRLTSTAGRWKIDDILLTVGTDGQAIDPPISVAANPHLFAAPPAAKPAPTPSPPARMAPVLGAAGADAARAATGKPAVAAKQAAHAATGALGGGVLAVIAGMNAIGRWAERRAEARRGSGAKGWVDSGSG